MYWPRWPRTPVDAVAEEALDHLGELPSAAAGRRTLLPNEQPLPAPPTPEPGACIVAPFALQWLRTRTSVAGPGSDSGDSRLWPRCVRHGRVGRARRRTFAVRVQHCLPHHGVVGAAAGVGAQRPGSPGPVSGRAGASSDPWLLPVPAQHDEKPGDPRGDSPARCGNRKHSALSRAVPDGDPASVEPSTAGNRPRIPSPPTLGKAAMSTRGWRPKCPMPPWHANSMPEECSAP